MSETEFINKADIMKFIVDRNKLLEAMQHTKMVMKKSLWLWANTYELKVQGDKWFQPTPQIAYENLVRLTMGKKVLDANPWVLAYTFEYLED